jgi:membrane fusion protein, multidrug efflux system
LKTKGWVAQAGLDTKTAAADEARARVERAKRTLDTQRNQVAYTELRADRDGVVSALPAEAGQVVAAGQAVSRVARLDELEAVVAIPEQKIDEVKSASAAVELWPATGKQYPANLREISPDADASSRTYEVRFAITTPDHDVRLGKTANVVLQQTDARTIARLPLSAVMNDAKGPMVWVVDPSGSKLERRAVSIESFGQETALVSSGLKNGEQVVSLGVHTLDSAMTVRVVETKAIAGASAPVRQH